MIRFFSMIFWAAVAALLVASLAGEHLTVSLRIWLAAFVCWIAGLVLLGAMRKAELVPARFRLLAVGKDKVDPEAARPLREFRSLEALLLRSSENERTHRQQLRPRLGAMADHFLLVHHGISRVAHPEQAAALLGDVAWLIDSDDDSSPAPSLDDIDRLLDRILPDNVLPPTGRMTA